ncbi:PASTA domain-containing protein [Candidatus Fermentibacteria bacterium]|nr:PASTA domain-containing protein [Candidatus Fermentibacteria bacterium]
MNESETAKMPDISGYSLRRALSLIRKIGLTPGRITYVDSKLRHYQVLEQDVPAGSQVPKGQAVNLVIAGKSLIRALPAVYQKEDSRSGEFLKRYLWIASSVLNGLESDIDHLHEYFDPMKAPQAFFRWLASWFAVNIDFAIPEAKLRMLVRESVTLYRWRGTALGLAKMLEIVTGVRPEIIEGSLPIREYTIREEKFLGQRTLDNAIIDEKTSRHLFTVTFPVFSSEFSEETIKKIHQVIREEKPAHAQYYVLFVPPADQRKSKDLWIKKNVIDDRMVF